MPRIGVNQIRLSDHARQRIIGRQIPHGAIWGAVDHPFSTAVTAEGRGIRTAPAVVGARRTWISVVLERLDPRRLVVITAFLGGRRRTGP